MDDTKPRAKDKPILGHLCVDRTLAIIDRVLSVETSPDIAIQRIRATVGHSHHDSIIESEVARRLGASDDQ